MDYAEIGDDIYEKNNNVEDLSVQVWLPCWSLQISFCWGEKKCIKEAKVGSSHRYTTAALVGIGLRKESLLSLFSFEIRTSALINVVYMAESKDMSQLSIGEFYENRSIFITGATGFIGKVLVEKILRCCPGVERLYLLMRPSKGLSVDYRLREFIQNEVSLHSAFIELTPKQK